MARKKKKATKAGDGTVVMMVSLNLILVIFFVYLNSIGVDDKQRIKKALGGLAGTFGMLPSGLHLTAGKQLAPPGAPMVSPEYNKVSLGRAFTRLINERVEDKETFVTQEGDDLIIHIPGELLFSSGSSKINDESEDIFKEIKRILSDNPFPLRIEGHTDNLPMSSEKYPSNWELSAARATSILLHLVNRYKIPIDQITAVGLGEFHPLLPNNREKNRKKNRRIRIILIGAAV